jgi:hypothetical protein
MEENILRSFLMWMGRAFQSTRQLSNLNDVLADLPRLFVKRLANAMSLQILSLAVQ